MELEDIITLGACSILAANSSANEETVRIAVKIAHLVWLETLKEPWKEDEK